jgi:ArsR family transcriptional regulator, zinc-responsive transcriptional repressor
MNATEQYASAGELLRALAAPLRIAIVTELGSSSRCVHELVESLGAPQPLISQHLRVLRSAGVVRGARRGREIEYALTDEHIAHIVADAVSHANEAPVSHANEVPVSHVNEAPVSLADEVPR